MLPAKSETQRLYSDIRRDFDKLSSIKEFGVLKYRNEWIFAKLGIKYYKSPRTIENIIFSVTLYGSMGQLDLFNQQ